MTATAGDQSPDAQRRPPGPYPNLDELQARAGAVATEFSLLGFGSALFVATSLAIATLGDAVLPIARQAIVVATGLVAGGMLSLVASHHYDIGACRSRARHMHRLMWPILVLAALLTGVGGLALTLSWPGLGHPLWSAPAIRVLVAGSLLLAVPLLAGLGLRALGASPSPLPQPMLQLVQACCHTMTCGAVVLLVLCTTAQAVGPSVRHSVAAAVCTLAAQSLVVAAWLLRESRRVVRLLRASATRLPGVVRCHRIASAATVGGLMLPSLMILHALVTGRDLAILPACLMLIAANHAMRFAWVLAGWRSTQA